MQKRSIGNAEQLSKGGWGQSIHAPRDGLSVDGVVPEQVGFAVTVEIGG
jgi:hypothetical protein